MSALLRAATLQDCDALRALCLRSKGYWGYDTSFLEACRKELTITPQHIDHRLITDYHPDVDTLTIDVNDADEDSEDRSVSSISLTQTEDLGVFTSELVITFAATEAAEASTTALTIITNRPFELEDIQFNGL